MERPADVTLTGAVVRLEPLAEVHAGDLREVVAADRAAFTVYGPGVHQHGLDGWLAEALAEREGGLRLPFAVILLAGDRAVGSSSYIDIAPADGRIEVGHTWYGGPWQGTAVNPDAKLLLLGHAFEALGASRVTLKTDARNARSRRAIAGMGATFEGILRKHSRRADGPGLRDVAIFSVVDDEWPAVRVRLEARVADLRSRTARTS
jgi:RimJ/RimL family protein N-acetyltransferase